MKENGQNFEKRTKKNNERKWQKVSKTVKRMT